MLETSFFDEKKILKAARKATYKGVDRATAYLWKVAVRNVRKRDDREKEHPLHIFDASGNPIRTVAQHMASPGRGRERIVVSNKKHVRIPASVGSTLIRKKSKPGSSPNTHRTIQPGWKDFWLREGIKFSRPDGVVYVNPPHVNKTGTSRTIPQLMELGGPAMSNNRKLVGYYVRTRRLINGDVHVSYTRVYERSSKRINIKARPFLKPALEKAAEKLIEILKNSIK